MIRVQATIPGGSTSLITDAAIGFDLVGNYNTARLDNGDYCVIAPAGVLVAETTPAFGAVGIRNSNGAEVDPVPGVTQPFDDYAGAYNISTAHDPTTVIYPGSVLVKMTGINPAPAAARDGVADQWAVLHVVASAPAAHAISPAVWTGPNRPWDVLDIDGVLASLPSYAASGDEVTWASLKPIIGKRDIGTAMDAGSALPYQELTRNGTGLGGSNYGSYLSIRLNKARIGMLSNTWSSTDKEECLLAMAVLGYDIWRARSSAGPDFPVDGGHYQFEPDLMLLGLKASGNLASYSSIIPYLGNVSRQPFIHDAATVALLTPHNDLTKPYIYRWRDVVTLISDTQVTVAHSDVGDQADKTAFRDGIAVRERDGAERAITVNTQVGPDNAITGWTWTFASALTGTLITDRFHVKPPYAVSVGTPDWCIRGIAVPRSMNPLANAQYRQENEWSMAHRFARAMGMVGTQLAGWDQYTLYAEAGTNGMPNPIHAGSAAFIAAHSAAILAIPQIV